MNKYFMIPREKDLNKYKENIILPIEEFSIGFDVYYSVKEINKISSERETSVIINKLLHKKELNKVIEVIKELKNIKYYFIEDLGLINYINKENIVLYQNHILSNYESIRAYKDLGIKNIMISNELTIEEICEIKDKTNSNLFYMFISRNTLLYSNRKLVSSYNEYKCAFMNKKSIIKEDVSGKELIIKEEGDSTLIFDKNIFSANEVVKLLDNINLVINFSNMNEFEEDKILNNYKKDNLGLEIDDYFLKNKIGYKISDIK